MHHVCRLWAKITRYEGEGDLNNRLPDLLVGGSNPPLIEIKVKYLLACKQTGPCDAHEPAISCAWESEEQTLTVRLPLSEILTDDPEPWQGIKPKYTQADCLKCLAKCTRKGWQSVTCVAKCNEKGGPCELFSLDAEKVEAILKNAVQDAMENLPLNVPGGVPCQCGHGLPPGGLIHWRMRIAAKAFCDELCMRAHN